MLTPFEEYRRRYTVGVLKSISIFGAFLMLGLLTKSRVAPTELIFAMCMIIGGMTYATIRDTAGVSAYALESPKFYRDETDFLLLGCYVSGWRRGLIYLAKPLLPAILLTIIFAAFGALCQAWWMETPSAGLVVTGLLLVAVYPIILSWLIYMLLPVWVGWKEVQVRMTSHKSAGTMSIPCLVHNIAAQDLLIAMLIAFSLVLPIRHSPEFQPSLGYGSPEFLLAALLLAMIVTTLILLSAWRTRIYACSGDLYRSQNIDLDSFPSIVTVGFTDRWRRWFRYCFGVCVLTIMTCLTLGVVCADAPIQMVLMLVLLPVGGVFWIERTFVLNANFRDAAQLVSEFPVLPLSPEQISGLGKL